MPSDTRTRARISLSAITHALDKVARPSQRAPPRRKGSMAYAAFNLVRPFIVVLLLVTICSYLFLRSTEVPAATTAVTSKQPSFDFDAHLSPHRLALDEEDEGEAHDGIQGHDDALGGDVEGDDSSAEDEEVATEATEDETAAGQLHPSLQQSSSNYLAQPFLPFTCEPCSTLSASHPAPPTCAKYARPAADSPSPFNPVILDRATLFPGTGAEVQRVLKRAIKSSQYGAKRVRDGEEEGEVKLEDEDPFRIIVLGGSVSNCRGVDEKTTCWHAHILRWFQRTFPMEGDRAVGSPPPPYTGIQRLDSDSAKARVTKRAVDIVNVPAASFERKPATKRRKGKSGKQKAKKPKHRGQPLTRLINASKSATGSAFFAYCLEQELTTRKKNVEWGKGPDLVVIEVGINDVWPLNDTATKDFEKLLRTLRSMPSAPAIVILEAASLLLAQTTSFTTNAEYLHLPAAQFYDVPILSAKQALFGPTPALLPSSGLKIEDIFLPDLHHPNEQGHQLLADILISYLERQACETQDEILKTASARIGGSDAAPYVDPAVDIGRRQDELILPLPHRSLFDPFNPSKLDEYKLSKPTCLQVGHNKSKVVPKRNSGWTKFAWARDKQYLVAEKPGSKVTFDVTVGEGGTVLVDHLRSRFYNLGNVLVYLDDDKKAGKVLEGWWDLGWSIGVPTEVFSGVKSGPHTVTFELLPSSRSSHPLKKTAFRLIGLITT